jgi:hypothetical protein
LIRTLLILITTSIETVKVKVGWWLVFLAANGAEVTFADKIHQIDISICLDFSLGCVCSLEFVHDSDIKIVFFVTIIGISIFSFFDCLKLISIHATSDFFCNLSYFARIVAVDNNT